MNLPGTDPVNDPAGLWALQWQLIVIAERELGPRDGLITVFQPTFADDGPFLRNTPNFDGAFVELSRNAEHYWPTAVFEMAHETVHLLNPVVRDAGNMLEESVVVAFSLHVQPMYGFTMPVTMPSYAEAMRLAESLPGGALPAGRLIRESAGALSCATEELLGRLFPGLDRGTRARLAGRFNRDPVD